MINAKEARAVVVGGRGDGSSYYVDVCVCVCVYLHGVANNKTMKYNKV